jgi:undecaprenyl-diphosphatase
MVPVLPARVRPWVAVLLAALGAGFLLLAASVWHGHRALAFDQTVQRALGVPNWAQRDNQPLGGAVAALGSGPAVAAGSVVLAGLVYRRRGRDAWALALTAIALPVAATVEWVVKPLVGRRYFGNAYRFPSGHAATVTAVVVVAWLLLGPGARSAASRAVVALAGLCLIGLVSWGLLVTRVHSPVDVIGGWLFGAGLALAVASALDAAARAGGRRESAIGRVP